jgi:PadR family transcriptional regulator PadR
MPPSQSKAQNALLHGTLDALILKTLVRGPNHGYAIARSIEDITGDAVLIEDGSLYPALYRLELKGWVEAEWGTSELGRRAQLYRITDAGREHLAAAMATWKKFAAGVSKVLLAS